jgi:hypothetical protein
MAMGVFGPWSIGCSMQDQVALQGRIDWLKGLKENIILDGIVLAGTGWFYFKFVQWVKMGSL